MAPIPRQSSFVTQLRVRETFLIFFIVFVTLGVYYPAILGPFFLLDDTMESIAVANMSSWSQAKDVFFMAGEIAYHRPLSALIFFVIAKISGGKPQALHLFNVLVHLGCGLLIYLMVKRIYGMAPGKTWMAFSAALIFLLHPVNVEAVAWISARPSILSTFFILAAFCTHIGIRQELKDWRIWAAALLYLLSLLSYELTLFMPLVFLFWDLEQQSSTRLWQGAKENWKRLLPYGLALFLYLSLRILTRLSATGGAAEDGRDFFLFYLVPLISRTLSHLVSPVVAIGFYFKKVFWPWPLNFHIYQVTRPLYLLLGIAVLSILVWSMWKRTWWRFWLVWFVCAIVMVLPVSFLGYSWTPAAERYLYLASIGFAVGVSFLAFQVLALRPRWSLQTVQRMVLVLIFVFGITTALRAKVWQSNLTMMEDTLEKSPDSGKVTYAYGWALSSAGRLEEGITYWKKAIDLGYVSEPSRMLGQVEEARGNYDEAEQYFLQALWPTPRKTKSGAERSPEKGLFNKRDPEIYLQLARMHRRMAEEMEEEADYHHERMIHYHEAAQKLRPDDAYMGYLLAKAYLHFGDPAEAAKLFARVSIQAPDTYYGRAAAKLARAAEAKSRQGVQ